MLRSIGSVTFLALFMVGCGGGGAGGTPPPPPPEVAALSYFISTIAEVGTAYGPWPPSVSGGSASAFAVTPALPAGLSLDPNTGVIGGTPQAAAPQGTYYISAQIAGSSATFDLPLTVEAPPSNMSYASPVRAVVGTALSPLVPTLSGTAVFYNVGPSLPAGLNFDSITGVVSGTPTSARVEATYNIVANNDLASTTSADLVLAVDPPPTGTPMTGFFRGATVIGLGYDSGAQTGVTDSNGQFAYESGHGIAFHVGGVVLGTASMAKPLLTPVDLVANGTGSSEPVLNRVRFLMMLDQDGDPRNGIQISSAVTAAAASWAPVDFNTTDLPAALGAVIQQARTADGGSHALPDAASAQAFLRAAYACAYSGDYQGTYTADATPGVHGAFDARVFPDGSMQVHAWAPPDHTDFSIASANAVNPSLDGSVAVITPGSNLTVKGRFSDPTFLAGTTYLAGEAGTFQAAGGAELGPTYVFFPAVLGTPGDPATAAFSRDDPLTMDGSGNVTGRIPFGYLTGVVSGADLTGTVNASVGSTWRSVICHLRCHRGRVEHDWRLRARCAVHRGRQCCRLVHGARLQSELSVGHEWNRAPFTNSPAWLGAWLQLGLG